MTVSADRAAADNCDGLVVPGVGAFAACVAGLQAVGGEQIVRSRVAAGRPLLGICVGMQVLFEAGVEHGVESVGSRRAARTGRGAARPDRPAHGLEHRRRRRPAPRCSAACDADARFYFVHSYAAHETEGEVTRAVHGEPFVAAVERGPVSATQFHPEKSADAGAALLENWLATL